MNKILALDIGKVRVGISLSDSLKIIAQPYATIQYDKGNIDEMIESLSKIIDKFNIKTIVYGLPLNMDGSNSETTLYVEDVIAKLKTVFNIEFIAQDERWSTKAATKLINAGNFKKSHRKAKKDEIAATLILQAYLDNL